MIVILQDSKKVFNTCLMRLNSFKQFNYTISKSMSVIILHWIMKLWIS